MNALDRYYAACNGPRIWWRFWFEVTGQGRMARRYMRATRRADKIEQGEL